MILDMVAKRMSSGAKRFIPDKGSKTGKVAKPRSSSGFTSGAPWKAFASKAKGGYKSNMTKSNKKSK
jgi:hypothetical protein